MLWWGRLQPVNPSAARTPLASPSAPPSSRAGPRLTLPAAPLPGLSWSPAGCLECHIDLSLRCIKRGEANHAMFPAARLTWTRHRFALPDQLSNHGANRIRGHLFGRLEDRGVFHATAPYRA